MNETYNSPIRSPEKSDDDSTETGSDKKKSKYSNKTVIFGGKVAESAFDTPPKKPERAESLWERWAKMDSPVLEKAGAAPDSHEDGERYKPKPEVPLESLSDFEAKAVVAEYADNRKQLVRQEVHASTSELADDTETDDSAAAVEAAADAALLEEIDRQLAENPDKTVEEVVDAAEVRTIERIDGGLSEDAAAPSESLPENPDEDQPGEQAEPTAEEFGDADEVEIPLRPSAAEAADAEDDEAAAVPASGSIGGGSVPPVPPVPPASSSSTGGSSGSAGGVGGSGSMPPTSFYGGAGGMPPFPPRGGGPGGPGYAGGPGGAGGPGSPAVFNKAPAAAFKTAEMAFADERRALAQGLLVGGIIGYLIGKRRGRIKTEKKLIPIQKKLEKQVATLQETVAFKEQNIRKLAGEKAQALSMVERINLAERLAPPPTSIPSRERVAPAATRNVLDKASAEKSSTRSSEVAERFGRVLVEAPAAVVLGGAAALRSETLKGQEASRPVLDFNKKAEAYSTEELKQAAEKIKIDNTTLRELYDDGRLDEKAVRRVMAEFIDGGSVRAAVSRELLQKELKFERDPNMRNAAGPSASGRGGGGSGSASTTSATIAAAIFGSSDQVSVAGQDNSSSITHSSSRPEPDKATLDKLRKRQMAEVGAASAVIVTIFGIIIALLV